MKINKAGIYGEVLAARYLREHKFKIITGNFRTRQGEIDIIAKKGKYLCYIEVKARSLNSIAEPAEFVDKKKQKRIILAAKTFQMVYPVKKQERFDVIEVVFDEKLEPVSVNYIENAFEVNSNS